MDDTWIANTRPVQCSSTDDQPTQTHYHLFVTGIVLAETVEVRDAAGPFMLVDDARLFPAQRYKKSERVGLRTNLFHHTRCSETTRFPTHRLT